MPVMLAEVLEALQPRDQGRYVDGTVGGGGHAAAILRNSWPGGWLFGCDRDGAAIEAAREHLAEYRGRFELMRGNFADLAAWVEARSCDGVLLDLGVSSPQLDQPERGFSFQRDGPLDMRQDQSQALTAGTLVNERDPEELARLFWEYGGERNARQIARAIERERQSCRIERTLQLAGLIERVAPRAGQRIHPATRVFQALRMAVNDELGSLRRGLAAAVTVLKSGGRLAVITFHSAEDRVVKEVGREQTRDYRVIGGVDVPELRQASPAQMRWVWRKARKPGPPELAANPRSRSAQLKVLQKI